MIDIEGRCWQEINDSENLKRDCNALKNFKKENSIEKEYFEFMKCVNVKDYPIESVKLLRMFIEFVQHRR